MSDVSLFAGDRYYRSQFDTGQASYTIFKKDDTYYADPGYPGGTPYSSTDEDALFASVNTALSPGGMIHLKNETYSFDNPWAISSGAIRVRGENKTKTILRAKGNTNLLNVTGDYCHLENLSLDTLSAQTAGIGLNVTGDFFTADHLRLGLVESRQHFYQGLFLNTKFSVLRDITINNAQNFALKISNGAKNDLRISDLLIDNWGADIFTSNPAGVVLTSGTALFFNRTTIAHCDPGLQIIPGAGEIVFETLFTDLILDTNWGVGGSILAGSGTIHNIRIKDVYCGSNNRKASATEPSGAPGIRIQGVKTIGITGGLVGNEKFEGIIIDGAADCEVDIDNVTIHDNNQNNTTGALGTFAGAKTPGLFINGASVRLAIRGGSLDNPGHGASVGNQGGVYVNAAQKVLCSKVRLVQNVPASGPFGSNAGTGIVFMDDCPGYPTAGSVAISPTGSPFTYQNTTPLRISVIVSGGTVSQIDLLQGAATLLTGETSGVFVLNLADSIKVTYSVAPTMNYLPFRW